MQIFDHVTTRVGGRLIDAPFLQSGRSIDPEISVLVEQAEGEDGNTYLRFDAAGDTLFPGIEVATGENDLIALSEGLPIFVRDFEAQRTWSRGLAVGYRKAGLKGGNGVRMEARLQDQSVTHALLVLPSSVAGAPFVANGNRGRVQMGSVMLEKTFAHGQAQTGMEYGYGRFAIVLRDQQVARTRQ